MKIINGQNRNLYFICKSFIKIIDALIILITLGFYYTNMEYEFTKWYAFRLPNKPKTN